MPEKYKHINDGNTQSSRQKAEGFNIGNISGGINQIGGQGNTQIVNIHKYYNEEEEIWDIPNLLSAASVAYYNKLTSPGGRFEDLNIAEILLPSSQTHKKEDELIASAVMFNGATLGRLESIETLWKEEIPHSLILGDGGTGKTVSMIQLWKDFLSEEKTISGPIPIFVRLNEYNQATEEERKDFISWSIGWHYLGKKSLTPALKNAIWDWLRAEPATPHPKLLLMLDGFNEITVDNTQLLIELNNSWRRAAKGIQILLTSRYEANFEWTKGFQKLELQPLQKRNIIKYLSSKGKSYPEGNENLQAILRVPMMLTLYAASSEIQAKYQQDTNFQFKGLVSTTGELMWNFMEAQVVKYTQQYETEPQIAAHYRWLLKHFLPLIGYEMEKQGLFDFSRKQLKAVWKKYVAQLQEEERRDLHFELFAPSEVIWEKAEEEELEKVSLSSLLDDLSAHLRMLKKERNTYHFLHQNFRDFFAAVHLRNELLLSNAMKAPGVILKDRPLPVFIRKMLGEIEGEHYNRPRIVKDKWSIAHYKATILDNALACSRGIFGRDTIGYINWNILTIWKDLRQELSGCDLSHLDLSNVVMNGTRFSRPGLVAEMRGSKIRGENLFHDGHVDEVKSIQFSPNGDQIVSGSSDHTIKIWDSVSGGCLHTLEGHEEPVTSVCFNPKNGDIVSGSTDGTIKIWNRLSGECLRTMKGHYSYVASVHVSPQNGFIVSGSRDGAIKIWNSLSGECLFTFESPKDSVLSVCFSADGTRVLSGNRSNNIKVWDIKNGTCLNVLEGHKYAVSSVKFSPRNDRIISGSNDGTVKVWDSINGECLHTLIGHKSSIASIDINSKGDKIISGGGDGTVKIWDSIRGDCLHTMKGHDSFVESVHFSPDGLRIVSAGNDEAIKLWDVATGRHLYNLMGYQTSVWSIDVSPGGDKFICGDRENTVKIWDIPNERCLGVLVGHKDSVRSVQFSPEGSRIISGSDDDTIKIWDSVRGNCLKTLIGHEEGISSVCFSFDGSRIVSGSDDDTIKIWDSVRGNCLKTLIGHEEGISSVCFSFDGSRIVSGSDDDTIKIWDSCKREYVYKTLSGHKEVNRVCISPDGMKIASGGRDYDDQDMGQCKSGNV
jgi:WD40 repeat protein